MSSSEFNRIYGSGDRGYREATGILMPLYRKIIYDLGIGSHELALLLEQYIHDPKSRIVQSPKKRSQARGNFIKKLISKEGMSIRSFIDLVNALKVRRITISVRLEWDDREDTVHSITSEPSRSRAPPTEIDDSDEPG
jgi:hypothetical protein